jgi:hypothetical protein
VQSRKDIGDVLHDVIENDDVERIVCGQHIWKETTSSRQSSRSSQLRYTRVRFDSQHIKMAGRGFKKPTMSAANIQQPGASTVMWKASCQLLSKNSEITLPQRSQALFAQNFIQHFAITLDVDVDLQRASLVGAAGTLAVPTLKTFAQWLFASRTVTDFHALVSSSWASGGEAAESTDSRWLGTY